jgi:hypothetical protein
MESPESGDIMTAWSLALRDIPCPDYVHTVIVPLDDHGSTDPAAWARRIFSLRDMPRWVVAALVLRQAVSPMIGVQRAPRDVFNVREVAEDEALVAADDTHLDFRCAIAVDEDARMLRVITTVRLHNARGRLYFAPVRLAHPLVMRSMLRSAARSWHASV